MVKRIIANQHAIGLTTRGAEFVLIHLLEQWALIPRGPLELLEGLGHVLLGYVEHTYFECLVGLRIINQVMKPAPSAFQFLEVFVVQNQVYLFGQLPVELGHDGLDGLQGIRRHQRRLVQRLLRERLDGGLHRILRPVGLWFEFLGQQGFKITHFHCLCAGLFFCYLLICHGLTLLRSRVFSRLRHR